MKPIIYSAPTEDRLFAASISAYLTFTGLDWQADSSSDRVALVPGGHDDFSNEGLEEDELFAEAAWLDRDPDEDAADAVSYA